jgi:hypothetical protein
LDIKPAFETLQMQAHAFRITIPHLFRGRNLDFELTATGAGRPRLIAFSCASVAAEK